MFPAVFAIDEFEDIDTLKEFNEFKENLITDAKIVINSIAIASFLKGATPARAVSWSQLSYGLSTAQNAIKARSDGLTDPPAFPFLFGLTAPPVAGRNEAAQDLLIAPSLSAGTVQSNAQLTSLGISQVLSATSGNPEQPTVFRPALSTCRVRQSR